MIWKNLDSAIAFAATAHAGQVRKYDGLPYVLHPLRVMQRLYDTVPVVSEDELIAAVLHDTVEDTGVSVREIERRFGPKVASLVHDLTTPARTGNRAQRHQLELKRLAGISHLAQTIKLADLIDNTSMIVQHDLKFAKVYLPEKRDALAVLTDADPNMILEAQRSLTRAFSLLSLTELHDEGRFDGVAR